MKAKFRHIAALAALLFLLSGCNSIWSGLDGTMSELTLSITVSDTPAFPVSRGAGTRAISLNPDDFTAPVHDGEKMRSLRIIIVRPDGTVEHNRYLDFTGSAKGAYITVDNVRFEVYGPEKKQIYLFANEFVKSSDKSRKIVDYDLGSITPGSIFPEKDLSELKITLTSDEEQLPSEALPMSECHSISMPAMDYSAELYVTRAATKFTFLLDNTSSKEHSLSEISISKGSNIEYYLPRISYSGNPSDGSFSVDDYTVPNTGDNNNYYIFRYDCPGTVVASGATTRLEAIYLLEGKYTDAKDTRNYSMTATIDGVLYEDYFPDLSQLPRNTHVVVCLSIRDYEVVWDVKVYPYGEVWLNPGFGQ